MNLITLISILSISSIFSTFWYLYLHKKTRISKSFIFKDNVLVIVLTFLLLGFLSVLLDGIHSIIWIVLTPILVLGFSFLFTMYRFWRTPIRKVTAKDNELVSPADGNIIYIKKIPNGKIPISIKNGLSAEINEIAQTDLLNQEGWLIGINMTPFDVHKNCAPVSGEIVLNKHINGEFLSLKEPKAIIRNERNTLVIKNNNDEFFGIIQTASKLVRRIDSYVEEGQVINKGDWFGMIRFGSQVDLILPKKYNIKVEIGQQVFAIETIIASK